MARLVWRGQERRRPAAGAPLRTVEACGAAAEGAWRNRLIRGDRREVLSALLCEGEAGLGGRVNLVYIDPPFFTGTDFAHFKDTWESIDVYLGWFRETAELLRELLAENGSIYVHLDYHAGHYVKVLLDEIFGPGNFLNEVIWRRAFAHNDPARCGNIHDTILLYRKGERHTWNRVLQPPSRDYVDRFFDGYDEERRERYARLPLDAPRHGDGGSLVYEWRGAWPAKNRTWAYTRERMGELDREGRIHYPKRGKPRLKRYESEHAGTVLQDLWLDISKIHNRSPERLDFSTQKPEALLERILLASSHPGDLVLDCFVGSGTTAAVAEKLGRRWVGGDAQAEAVAVARERLLRIPGVRPFLVQEAGGG